MAYSRQKASACPLAIDPGVLSCYVPFSTAEINIPVRIPWDNVKLVHAEALTLEAVDGGDLEIDLEIIDAAGATVGEGMSLTVATSSSAIGTVTTATISNDSYCDNLGEDYQVNIEVDGHASGTVGAQMLYVF